MRTGKSTSIVKGVPKGTRVALVVSAFNGKVTEGLLRGSLETLKGAGIKEASIDIVRVPGSFEIPLAAKKLAKTKKYAGIVAIGCIIKGDTDHYYYVADAAASGVMQVMLETEVPIAFGILTTENEKQAVERSGTKGNKGAEAAEALLSMIVLHNSF